MARKVGMGKIARQEDLWYVVFKWFIIDNWQLKVCSVSARSEAVKLK